jgi:hypothetical protein
MPADFAVSAEFFDLSDFCVSVDMNATAFGEEFKINLVIPAKAGIYRECHVALCHGFPPQPALECFNRGRERQ